MAALVVLVDAENVRRSAWPNVSREELVERCRAWAAAEKVHATVVFDGPAPEGIDDEHCTVEGSGTETADELLERRAAELRARGARYWLVTSDRALRAAAGADAERTIGGGSFLRQL